MYASYVLEIEWFRNCAVDVIALIHPRSESLQLIAWQECFIFLEINLHELSHYFLVLIL